jgi:S-adenosylmethionine hydrolase
VHRDADLQELRVVENRRYFAATLSNTFHGRDIFAPVAAHIARGTALREFGPPPTGSNCWTCPTRAQSRRHGHGQVMLVDRFGNLITNISELDISAARRPHRGHFEVYLGDHRIGPLSATYADAPRANRSP